MSQRTALFLSALITGFILVTVSIVSQGVNALAALNDTSATADAALINNTNVRVQPLPTPIYQLGSDEAAQIAQKLAPTAKLQGTPELVNFQGTVAYEVVLDQGKVYVDANNGKVLSNGLAVATVGPVDMDQAVQIAEDYLQQNGTSAEVVGVRYGQARGMQLFEVSFENRVQIYVNADTGEVAIVRTPRRFRSDDH
ncbi:MAG: PepSY domain-containing protein [Caldilineaceae bacterium]